MIISTSTDIIQVKLSSAIITRQLNFYSAYNNITSTSTITPTKTFGNTNNTTAVTLMPSPGSSQQNQLRYCSIYNCDSVDNTVTVQLSGASGTRTLFTAYLFVGDYIQYTPTMGWQVYNFNGVLKKYGLAQLPTQTKDLQYVNYISGGGSLTITSGTDFAFYLGKADRAFNQVTVMYNVSTALGATITWAEIAIYKGYPTIGTSLTLTRCGFKDCNFSTGQSGFAATGLKRSNINVSNIFTGDDLWVVFGNVTNGTNMVLTSGNFVDDVGAGFLQTATGSLRPSTNSTISFTLQSATIVPWLVWQGYQW